MSTLAEAIAVLEAALEEVKKAAHLEGGMDETDEEFEAPAPRMRGRRKLHPSFTKKAPIEEEE